MATTDIKRRPKVAEVDQLVDENGQPIALPEATPLEVAGDVEDTVGATGPTAWWRFGLIGLGIVVLILLLFQVLMDGAQTNVVPGTPTTAPQQVPSQ